MPANIQTLFAGKAKVGRYFRLLGVAVFDLNSLFSNDGEILFLPLAKQIALLSKVLSQFIAPCQAIACFNHKFELLLSLPDLEELLCRRRHRKME